MDLKYDLRDSRRLVPTDPNAVAHRFAHVFSAIAQLQSDEGQVALDRVSRHLTEAGIAEPPNLQLGQPIGECVRLIVAAAYEAGAFPKVTLSDPLPAQEAVRSAAAHTHREFGETAARVEHVELSGLRWIIILSFDQVSGPRRYFKCQVDPDGTVPFCAPTDP